MKFSVLATMLVFDNNATMKLPSATQTIRQTTTARRRTSVPAESTSSRHQLLLVLITPPPPAKLSRPSRDNKIRETGN